MASLREGTRPTGGNRGGCAAEKLPVPRTPSMTRASPRALSAPPCGIPKLSFSPAPPPSRPPTPSPFKPHCLRLALPSVLIGETPPRRGWKAQPEQPRPPAPPPSRAAPAQSPEAARAVGSPRVSDCGRRAPRHLPPPSPQRAESSRARTHPACAPRSRDRRGRRARS